MTVENKITKETYKYCKKRKREEIINEYIRQNLHCPKPMITFKNTEHNEYPKICNCKICNRYLLKQDSVKNYIMASDKGIDRMTVENKITKETYKYCKKSKREEIINEYIKQNHHCPIPMVTFKNTDDNEYPKICNRKICNRYLLKQDSVKNYIIASDKGIDRMTVENKITKETYKYCKKRKREEIINEYIRQNLYCPKPMVTFENTEGYEYPKIWKSKICNKYMSTQDSAQNHICNRGIIKTTVDNEITKGILNYSKNCKREDINTSISRNLYCPKTMKTLKNTEDSVCNIYLSAHDSAQNHIMTHDKGIIKMTTVKKNIKEEFVYCKKLEQDKRKISIGQNLYCPKTMVIIKDSDNNKYPRIWKCKMCNKYLLTQKIAQYHTMRCDKEIIKTTVEIDIIKGILNYFKHSIQEDINESISQNPECPKTMEPLKNTKDIICNIYLSTQDLAQIHTMRCDKKIIKTTVGNNIIKGILNYKNRVQENKNESISQNPKYPKTMEPLKNNENSVCNIYLSTQDSALNHTMRCDKEIINSIVENKTYEPFVYCSKFEILETIEAKAQNLYCPETMILFMNIEDMGYPIIWKCKMCNKHLLNQDLAQNHFIECPDDLIKKELQLFKELMCDSSENKPTKKREYIYMNKNSYSNRNYIYKKCRRSFIE